jgi:hypothetical protein
LELWWGIQVVKEVNSMVWVMKPLVNSSEPEWDALANAKQTKHRLEYQTIGGLA